MIRIVEIAPGGPAAKAGLRLGDLIFALDGEKLPCWENDLERIEDLDSRYSAGDSVVYSFFREEPSASGASISKPHEVTLTFEAMAAEVQQELARWVTIARARLSQGVGLYCHDRRPSPSGTHHVCHDAPEKEP